MKIVDGMIVEATLAELREYWLSRNLDDFFDFHDYTARMVDAGVKIV